MRFRTTRLWAGGLVACLVLASGGFALADHNGQGGSELKGVVTQFSVTATTTTSGSSSGTTTAPCVTSSEHGGVARTWDHNRAAVCGTAIGTMTVETGNQGSVTVNILSTTRFDLTGADLADNLAGAVVNVQTVPAPTSTGSGSSSSSTTSTTPTLDAVNVEASPSQSMEGMAVRGTVTSVSSTSITIQTDQGSVTDALSPTVTVLLGDKQPGTLADVTQGSQIQAYWAVASGQVEITTIRVLGSEMHDQSMKGTVNAISTTSLTLNTNNGTWTATLAPTVTVTMGEHQAATLADVTQGTRVRVVWQAISGQNEVLAIQILGGNQGDH